MEGKNQKPLSSLYEDLAPAKKKVSTHAKCSLEDNPSIASLRQHPPPPRHLPTHIATGGHAAGCVSVSFRFASSLSRPSTPPVEEEIDDVEEQDEELDEEDKDEMYVPNENDEDVNAYDLDDDMSEEDVVGTIEDKPSIDISSGEDEARIENKVISITLDNASNNDVVVKDLKAKFTFWRCKQFEEVYFHVRCCAHIVNLVVQDGTSCMTSLITNLRETVKYFKKSTSRLHKFVEICRGLALTIGSHLTLDVCTRWISTYKMIATGRPYREALKDYAKSDLNYKWEPTSDEWNMYELIEPIHFAFAQVTTAFSAQAYPTTNIFYCHIVSIKIELRKAIAHRNPTYKAMGEAMMEKFNKYWEEKNNVMVLATILDPRYKMFYIDWAFKELYDEDTAMDEVADVHVELEELFDKFDTAKKMAEKSTTSSSNICITSSSMPTSDSAFQTHRRNTTTKSSKSELRNYLEDALEDPDPKFILLDWWKVKSLRYPVLAKMARWFLTIPTSSVSSESTFSTGGRVLDDYRSSLKPVMVEASVCGASYIKGSHSDLNVMEEEDDEENVETIKLPKGVVNNNYWNLN
ncbi:hypothetical protein ACQ4PT_049764 [Festuca glaucescens]